MNELPNESRDDLMQGTAIESTTDASLLADAWLLEDAELLRERLISRLTDGGISASDWRTLADAARADASILGDLALTRAQHETLCAAVAGTLSRADATDLQHASQTDIRTGVLAVLPAQADALYAVNKVTLPARWKMGWAVAAALALVAGYQFTLQHNRTTANGTEAIAAAGIINVGSADQALKAYYELGKAAGVVVTELPQRYVLESRTLPDGRQEVLYLRQVLERGIVSDVFRLGSDEQGRPVLVPSAPASSSGPAL